MASTAAMRSHWQAAPMGRIRGGSAATAPPRGWGADLGRRRLAGLAITGNGDAARERQRRCAYIPQGRNSRGLSSQSSKSAVSPVMFSAIVAGDDRGSVRVRVWRVRCSVLPAVHTFAGCLEGRAAVSFVVVEVRAEHLKPVRMVAESEDRGAARPAVDGQHFEVLAPVTVRRRGNVFGIGAVARESEHDVAAAKPQVLSGRPLVRAVDGGGGRRSRQISSACRMALCGSG